MLADCLTHARDQGAERLVDLATLTGGIVATFGPVHAGLMGNDDAWCDAVRAAGEATGERVWRLPLDPAYDELIKGRYGDLINSSEGRKAQSITAAAFLQPLRRRRAVGAPRHRRRRRRARPPVRAPRARRAGACGCCRAGHHNGLMDFDLSPDHELIRRTVRDFAEGEIAPVAEELDRDEARSRTRSSPSSASSG